MKKLLFFLFICFSQTLIAQLSVASNDTPSIHQHNNSAVISSQEVSNASPSTEKAAKKMNSELNPEEDATGKKMPFTQLEFNLSVIVLIFGFLVIIMQGWLIKTRRIASDDIIKFITITLIIIATLFLITAGYNNNQIAPAMGLLGTVAGYLLGKVQQVNTSEKNETTN